MAVLDIARMGAAVLREPARPVADSTAPEIARLVADMLETLASVGGIGIAAPQVRVGLRVVAFEVPARRTEDGVGSPMTVLVNPVWRALDDETEEAYEACLSVPGLAGMVPRFKRISYRGLRLDGTLVERVADGFHARVVQHECDHLEGMLYPLRMTDLSTLAYASELSRASEECAEPEPVAVE